MKNFLLMLCLICCFTSQGQVFFQKVFGTIAPAGFGCNKAIKTNDGGYIISGNKGYYHGSVHSAMIKLDSLGNPVWNKVYVSVNGYVVQDYMVQEGDSAYIMAGCRLGFGADKLTLFKTNSVGDIMWSTVFEDSTYGIYPDKIQKSSDGNFILLFNRVLGGIGNAGMLKFDGSGNILWSHLYLDAYCVDFIEFENGEIVIASVYSDVAQPFYPALIKIDANGNFLWRKGYNFPHSSSGSPYPICKTSDNGVLMAPVTDSTDAGNDINALVKLDSAGNVLWSYNYLGSGSLNVIKLLPDGGFLLGGSKQDNALVYRVDSIGNIEMSKIYGDEFHRESLVDIVADSDKGYLLISDRDTISNSLSNPTIYIVKADSTGYSGCNEALNSMVKTPYTTTSWNLGLVVDTVMLTPDSISFNITTNGNMSSICGEGFEEKYMRPLEIYPNPTTGKLTIEVSHDTISSIEVFNILGKQIGAWNNFSGHGEIQIDIRDLSSGIYFIQAICNKKIFTEKIIKR